MWIVSQYENDYSSLLPAASGNDGGGNSVVSSYGISAFPTVILIAPDKSIISQDIYPVEGLDSELSSAGLTETSCSSSGLEDIIMYSNEALNDKRVFDLLGREWKVEFKDLPDGIYIINRKKVLKRTGITH